MATTSNPGVWRDVSPGDSGPPVVLVHGTMDRSSSFGRMSRLLESRTVVRYDRRGYGRSVELGPPTSFDDQVDDLLDVIGSEPAVVFGHSYGGTVALATAARAPGAVVGVIAYECPLPWMDWWPADSVGARATAESSSAEDAAERFMIRMVGRRRWDRLPPSTRQARRREGPTLIAELQQIRPPRPAPFDLGDVTVPVVAANGTEGADHHRRSMAVVARDVPGARHVVVEGAGHGIHLTHPARAAALLEELPVG